MTVTFALDISNHQPLSLDLGQARRDGCELAIMKAGEGNSYVDPSFGANLAKARAAGQLVAAYWYQRSNATAQQHVDAISRVVPRDVPVCIDVEANSGNITLTRQIIDGLRAAGYRVPLLYLPRWYWQQIGSPSLIGLPPLWSSRYPDNVVGLLASEWSQVPASYWDGYGGIGVALLQFTSSARIAGYQPLDASAFRGDRNQLAALLGQPSVGASPAGTTSAPTTPVIPMEECMKDIAAGNGVQTRLFAAGRPHFLWLQVSGKGNKVTVDDIAYIKRTPTGSAPDYGPLGQPGYPDLRGKWFDADRPGPIQFADDVSWVWIKTTSTVESTAAIG